MRARAGAMGYTLNEYGLISEGKLNSLLTLNEDLVKSYDNVSDNVSDNEKKEKPENLIFPFKSENFKSAWQICQRTGVYQLTKQ